MVQLSILTAAWSVGETGPSPQFSIVQPPSSQLSIATRHNLSNSQPFNLFPALNHPRDTIFFFPAFSIRNPDTAF